MLFEETSLTITKLLNNTFVTKLSLIVFSLILIVIFIKLLKKLIDKRVADSTLRYKSKKMLGAVGFVIFCIFLIIVFYEKLNQLSIIFGLTGAGLAFALQDIIISFVAWLTIMFDHNFKTGDRVQIANVTGDVIDIGVLKTTLMECRAWVDGDLYSGRIVKLSNSNIFKGAVFNYSSDFPFLWDELTIQIRYGSNIKKSQEIIIGIANDQLTDYANKAQKSWNRVTKRYLIEDAQVQPLLTLIANENFMIFTLRYVVAYNQRRVTKSKLFEKILSEIDKHPEEVSIASASFDINKIPTIRVES